MTAIVVGEAPVPVAQVFAALVDPHTYPGWLVGARAIRAVDDGWPAPGTRFHQRVGLGGPLTVADSTESLDVEAPHRLDLEVRFRPFGRARVAFRLTEQTGGDGRRSTCIAFAEEPIGALAPLAPVLDPITSRRNRVSLDALIEMLTDACEAATG